MCSELNDPSDDKYSHPMGFAKFSIIDMPNVARFVDKGIAQRQTAGDYLNELENIGILESKKSGREKLYLNTALYKLLSQEKIG